MDMGGRIQEDMRGGGHERRRIEKNIQINK